MKIDVTITHQLEVSADERYCGTDCPWLHDTGHAFQYNCNLFGSVVKAVHATPRVGGVPTTLVRCESCIYVANQDVPQ